jgi:hypothetical protein
MRHVKEWAMVNRMELNIDKTKCIIFKNIKSRRKINPSILDGIETVDSIKILGVTFDNHLRFDKHVESLLKVIASRMFIVKRASYQVIRKVQLTIIFNGFVIPKLLYCSEIWSAYCNVKQKHKFDSIIKVAMKLGLLEKTNFEKICSIKDQKLFTKVTSNQRHLLHDLLPAKRANRYNCRERFHNFSLPCVRTELFKKAFINRCLFYC